MICFEFQLVDVQTQCDYAFLKDIRAKTSSNTVSTNMETFQICRIWSAHLRKIILSFSQFDSITTNSTKIECALPQNPLQKLEIKTKLAVLKTQRINTANPQVLLQQRFGCLIFKKSLQENGVYDAGIWQDDTSTTLESVKNPNSYRNI